MKFILLSSSYPLHPRMKKIFNYFKSDSQPLVCAWNRGGGEYDIDLKNEYIMHNNIGYGNKIKKLLNFFSFALFYYSTVKSTKPDYVICRYWDMFFIACILTPKNTKIIYDVCDMPSNKFIKFIETRLIRLSETVILSSRFFLPFYPYSNTVLYENKPDLKMFNDCNVNVYSGFKGQLNIAFIGKIRYFSIMVKLINAVDNLGENVLLNFYGGGSDELKLIKYCDENCIGNVVFHGEYEYKYIKNFYIQNDIIWGAYDSRMSNVKYAISNKFFESLEFNKVCVFSKKTELGKLITSKKIGFVVNENDTASIQELLSYLLHNPNAIKDVESNIYNLDKKII